MHAPRKPQILSNVEVDQDGLSLSRTVWVQLIAVQTTLVVPGPYQIWYEYMVDCIILLGNLPSEFPLLLLLVFVLVSSTLV